MKYKLKQNHYYVDHQYYRGDILIFNNIFKLWGMESFHTYYQRMFPQDYINEHPELFEELK